MTNEIQLANASRALRHVFLLDMVLLASVGVYAFEHETRQRVRVNVDLAVDDDGAQPLSRRAAGRDDLSRVVDYERVAKAVRSIIASGHVRLVETLAERIAEACFEDERVRVARVRVEKLDIFSDTEAVGVEIERLAPNRAHGGG
jgi:7,8-dihydroneopterin aldolase/epimerase/oxygenase